jgi:hypothetical protein
MTTLPRTPYHIREQQADALLAPVAATLDDLDARLTQYVERLRMPEADRAAVAKARDVVRKARAELRVG